MAARMDALNYPYIRVRSADWLKRTLLIFPHVVRMTPFQDAPADDPEVAAFASYESGNKPLLRAADLFAGHVRAAQLELVQELRNRLEAEGPIFRRRFGWKAAHGAHGIVGKSTVWDRRLSFGATFQIHRYKIFHELSEFLREEDLAWTPDSEFADGPDYLEMHPQLGEAVMATLAMACAENEGLQVVTEFPQLHSKLLGIPREKILTACLDGVAPSGETSGRQIAEFLVYRRCNVDMLSAENIVALKQERDALADFRGKLDELAKTLPPTIFSEKVLQEKLNEALNDMFREWARDQANLSSCRAQALRRRTHQGNKESDPEVGRGGDGWQLGWCTCAKECRRGLCDRACLPWVRELDRNPQSCKGKSTSLPHHATGSGGKLLARPIGR